MTGESFESLLVILRSGNPVIAWTKLEQRYYYYGKTWTDNDAYVIDWYDTNTLLF